MAEGSYGSPFYQGNMTPVEGNTSQNKFATNMNRKKTRKWVEAKKINYDGSGWGDEDEDEEDDGYGGGGYGDEPMPAMPAMPSQLPSQLPSQFPSQHQPPLPALPSQAPPPSQSTLSPTGVTVGGAHPTAAIRARNSPSPMGRVPLNVQTQPQQQQAPQQAYSQPPAQQQQQQQPTPTTWRQPSPQPRSGSQTPGGTYTPWREGQGQGQGQGRSESPMGPRGQSQSPAGVAAGVVPPPNAAPAGPRTMSPAGAGAGAGPNGPNGPRGNFIRPSDIYKRADSVETVDRGRKEQSGAPATGAITVDHTSINNNTTAPVELAAAPQSPTQHKPHDSVDSTASADDAANDRRYSTSPKLPDLARFSTFSPELLFGGSASGFLSSDAPPVPSIPNSPAVQSFPESSSSQSQPKHLSSVAENVASTSRNASPFSTSSRESSSGAPIRDSAATTATVVTSSSMDDTTSSVTAAGGAGVRGSADSTPSSVDVPPTSAAAAGAAAEESRKSSEVPAAVEPETNTAEEQPTSATSTYSDPMIAMTAPLNPHRLSSMVPFMPPPVTTPKGPRDMQSMQMQQRTPETAESTPTTTTAANSPVKESDVLREEIIRTLSPIKGTHSGDSLEGAVATNDNDIEETTTADTSAKRSDHTRTLTRESSYLQDVYDDYWTPDGDDASGNNETYTASDPPPPIPPLASAGAGAVSGPGTTAAADSTTESTTSLTSSAAPAALAAAAVAAAAAGAAGFAAGHSSTTTEETSAPAPATEARHLLPSQQGLAPSSTAPAAAASIPPAKSPSPTPSASGLPGAFPASNVPTPGAEPSQSQAAPAPAPAQAAAAVAFANSANAKGAPSLRRRFSWEAEPEQPAANTGTGAFTAVRAATMQSHPASSTSPPPDQSQSPPPPALSGSSLLSSPVSAAGPSANDLQPQRTISPHPTDANTVVSAVSTSTVAPELTAPSPISEAAEGTTTAAADATAEAGAGEKPQDRSPPQTQAPVRSMLDVGDAPARAPQPIRSMLDVGDDPLPKQLVNRISTAESMQSTTSYQSQANQPQSQHQSQVYSPTAAPSIQVYQPAAAAPTTAPVRSPTSAGASGVPAHNNPALFGSGTEGTGQFLTLRQCMAHGTHQERMGKLIETRHEYANADSGLGSWLQSMTAVPEYARAAYAPLFDNHVGGAGPAPSSSAGVAGSRPVAAVAATISRVPHHVHVAVPSGAQISNKSKEIFSVATGKAGKGLLALRKKGFHKKSAN